MRRLLTPGWIAAHAGAAALVIGFLLLGWWQIRRAVGGNLLSFGYAIEWPVFAAFVVFAWVKEALRVLRSAAPTQDAPGYDTPSPDTSPDAGAAPDRAAARSPLRRPSRSGPAYDDSGDDELAAYNRYLAWLNAHPHATPSQYPG